MLYRFIAIERIGTVSADDYDDLGFSSRLQCARWLCAQVRRGLLVRVAEGVYRMAMGVRL